MSEVRGANQAIEPDIRFLIEMMKHQRAAAKAIRAHFEGGPVDRKGIVTAGPVSRVAGNGVGKVVLAVIEDQLEAPVHRQGNRSRLS